MKIFATILLVICALIGLFALNRYHVFDDSNHLPPFAQYNLEIQLGPIIEQYQEKTGGQIEEIEIGQLLDLVCSELGLNRNDYGERDPWGNLYYIKKVSEGNRHGFELRSNGLDGVPSEDDIVYLSTK
ncbi:type II secretion system protein GspG [Puniceicoccaceae bacterium K14]|nr:type II secretion system protein GspG [Puniceicoccaceae bacterium K14]